jgi:hypothetical protein
MYRFRASLFVVAILGLALMVATSGPSNAQRSDEGTGAGAGNSPPIDDLRGGAAMPDATAPMDPPPTPPGENAGQAAPQENNAAAPEENKTPVPDDDAKKEGPPDPD